MPYKRRAKAPVRRRKNALPTARKRRVYKKTVMRRKVRKSSHYRRVHYFDTMKGFGERVRLRVHGRATVVVSTDGTTDDAYAVALASQAPPSTTLVHTAIWPPTTAATSANDLNELCFDSWSSSLDTKTGILPALLTGFGRLIVRGFRVRAHFEPSDNGFASNNLAMWIGVVPRQQAAASVPQSITGHFYDYICLMPRSSVRIKSMPSSIVAGAATQAPITITKYFSMRKINPEYYRDPETFGQGITGQLSSVGSVAISSPTNNVGYFTVGFCSKDGGTFSSTTILGRLTLTIATDVELYSPMIYSGYGSYASPAPVEEKDEESDDESSDDEETPTPKVVKVKKRRSVKVTVKQ